LEYEIGELMKKRKNKKQRQYQ